MVTNLLFMGIGFILSSIIYLIIHLNGRLDIDTVHNEKDTYRITINDFDKLEKRKLLLLIINKNANLSK